MKICQFFRPVDFDWVDPIRIGLCRESIGRCNVLVPELGETAAAAMLLPFGRRLALLKAKKFPTMEGFPTPEALTSSATYRNQGTGLERFKREKLGGFLASQ